MIVRGCRSCDWWEQAFLTEAEADRAEAAHRVRHHADPAPITQLRSVVTRAAFIEAARTLAATGQEFRSSDLPDVEHYKTSKGQLMREIHRLGIAHPIRYDRSRRKETKASAAAVWHEDRDQCMECPRLVVPA